MALASLAASSQAAPTVKVQFDNPIFNGVSGQPSDDVRITFGAQSANTSAGRFQGTVLNYTEVDASIFVDSLDDLLMYCYDVYERIGSGWVVSYTIILGGESARTLDFLGAVNHVLNPGKSKDDPFAWLHPRNGAEAAAIQLGIWESKYEPETWDIEAGTFSAKHVNGGTMAELKSTSRPWTSRTRWKARTS